MGLLLWCRSISGEAGVPASVSLPTEMRPGEHPPSSLLTPCGHPIGISHLIVGNFGRFLHAEARDLLATRHQGLAQNRRVLDTSR